MVATVIGRVQDELGITIIESQLGNIHPLPFTQVCFLVVVRGLFL